MSVSVERRSPYRLGERVREKASGNLGIVIEVNPVEFEVEVVFVGKPGGSPGAEDEFEPFDFEDERERARATN